MRYILTKLARHLMWRIRMLALIIIVLSSVPHLYLHPEEGTPEDMEVALVAEAQQHLTARLAKEPRPAVPLSLLQARVRLSVLPGTAGAIAIIASSLYSR